MRVRIAYPPAIGLIVLLAAFAAIASGGGGPDDRTPILVGSQRISASMVENRAATLGDRSVESMASARLRVSDRMIEELWLRGEAAERELPTSGSISTLRARVADAVAGKERRPLRFLVAFARFHNRWRAQTRCIAAVHDPYADRCSNRPPAAAGTCQWVGQGSLCSARVQGRRMWIVVKKGRDVRTRSRRVAAAAALAVYRQARSRRDRRVQAALAARRRVAEGRRLLDARRQAAADQARRRQIAEQARRKRLALPEVSAPTLRRARVACRQYREDIDPYLFGAGLQDLRGQIEGFRYARAGAARRLAHAAADRVDETKLRPLLQRLRAGDEILGRIDAAAASGDLEVAYSHLALFDRATRVEENLAAKLGLADCLPSPTR